MKKILLISLLFLAACSDDDNMVTISQEQYNKAIRGDSTPTYPIILPNPTTPSSYFDVKTCIILIDSCEYVTYAFGSDWGVMSHKGNCKFCERRWKQYLELLIKKP